MADANPLYNSLPAEVVFRRRPREFREKPTDEVAVDLQVALASKPDARIKWFTKACEMVKGGRASSRDLFDIISNRKFTAGLPRKIGRKISAIAHENCMFFSQKQQRYMQSSEWILNAKYGVDMAERRDGEDSAEDNEEDREECDASDAGNFAEGERGPRRDQDAFGDRVEGQRDRSRSFERDPVELSAREERERELRHQERKRKAEDYAEYFMSRLQGRQKKSVEEEQQQARREALEQRLAEDERERQRRREARKRQAEEETNATIFHAEAGEIQQKKKMQLEQEADSSLQMLERLSQRQQAPDEEALRLYEAPRRRGRRGYNSRSRSAPMRSEYGTGRRRRRGERGRSRSLSVQAASISPSPNTRRRQNAVPGDTFEQALARRMSQRESEMDSARIPVTWTREEMRRGMHQPIRSKRPPSGKLFSS